MDTCLGTGLFYHSLKLEIAACIIGETAFDSFGIILAFWLAECCSWIGRPHFDVTDWVRSLG